MEAVALDVEKPVEDELPSRDLRFVSTNTGIVGFRCSTKILVWRTTTSDIVGLIPADAGVHNKAIAIIFFTYSPL